MVCGLSRIYKGIGVYRNPQYRRIKRELSKNLSGHRKVGDDEGNESVIIEREWT